ncbi:FadR/GntR family transcriptional regulator [Lacrimispora sp. 210928-DFI.3.58]|uniref:FadR/GntR family transcriptional regulator n=1 Tax=Lacrimispora sp. 210928-DFI.3.58 TaxID=2883214 RepID=UPI0015B482C4|nr:FadR/GntR family transcriptional regulator [Lacrimispora sp. 210928-DFI.3.58]MCB7318893.1 FadR family transcriptional regulator [Lacrimispora sp. 210928-DFI.3.58]
METVKRIPVVQQVVEKIKEYLFSGDVSVGDKLPVEKELCQQLGVGRGTVREAFRMLEATGYVELRPGKGAFAARTSEVELGDILHWFAEHEVETRDFLEVRMAIEPLSVRLAIERCSDEDVAHLEQLHQKFITAVKSKDVSSIVIYDEKFHSSIVEFSKNHLLISISKQVEQHVKNFRSRTFYIPQNAENAIQPHQSILDAFKARDAKAGERNMQQHLELVAADLAKSTTK